MSAADNTLKFVRAAQMYGLHRAYAKAAGRLNADLRVFPPGLPKDRDVSLIGCGQFGFASISYFVGKKFGNRFRLCFDIARDRAVKLCRAYRYNAVAGGADELLTDPATKFVYIASNHATHTPYAVKALRAGKSVHIEKPVATSWEQLSELARTVEDTANVPVIGYNRPFSAAVRLLDRTVSGSANPMTVSCIIAGHMLRPDHWYRNAEEGTRICGNVAHWLDLSVHMLNLGSLANFWTLRLAPSNPEDANDNINLTLTSERGDLVTIVLTARLEPPEGVHELIFVQKDDVMARIDDFQAMTLWRNQRRKNMRFRPKDVGHKAAILQMFTLDDAERKARWRNALCSSLWMLTLADMVREHETCRAFCFSDALARVMGDTASPA